MNRIILASHGGLSAGMKDTVQMILGEMPNLYALATLRDETEPITVAARRLLEDFAAEDAVYIVTDVMGGQINMIRVVFKRFHRRIQPIQKRFIAQLSFAAVLHTVEICLKKLNPRVTF